MGRSLAEVDAVAYTRGPGLAGALLVGCAFAEAPALALGKTHHSRPSFEGHLLSPLLSRDPPTFPFVALLVSGGHTQLMKVTGVGQYELLGETLDDAAGEAFDKSAKLLGLPYPGGALLSRMAASGTPGKYALPRPTLHPGRSRFQFFRFEDGSSHAGARSGRTASAEFRPMPLARFRKPLSKCW